MDFVKQFTSPGGKASPTKAGAAAEGGAAPANTPTASTAAASTSAPAVGGGDTPKIPTTTTTTTTTLGHALGKMLSEVQQGGGLGQVSQGQLAAYGQELGAAAAARERAGAPHQSVAELGRDAAGEAWDDVRGGGGADNNKKKTPATRTTRTKAEALRDDDDDDDDDEDAAAGVVGAPAQNKSVTRSTAGLGRDEDGGAAPKN